MDLKIYINKAFLLNMLILAFAVGETTVLYFAQMDLLYEYFDPNTVYLATISFAYLAQGTGLLSFMLLLKFKPSIVRNHCLLATIMFVFIPIIIATPFVNSGALLMTLVIITNYLIGFVHGNCFSNIAVFVDKKQIGLCWSGAYAIGNIMTWMISQLDVTFIASPGLLPILCIMIGINIFLIMLSSDFPTIDNSAGVIAKKNYNKFIWIALTILLMSIIYTIGSTDYSMIVEKAATSSTLFTRCLYSAGLLIAGVLYDKSHKLGAVLALSSVIYPIMASMLLKTDFSINLIYSISYFVLGFLSVYRSAAFISLGNEDQNFLFLSGFGLMISRFTEGIISLFTTIIVKNEVVGFIICGILFIPLIIVFCMLVLMQNRQTPPSEEEKLADFAKKYALTRREEEIVALLIHGATNGEIAEALTISDSTARFHVSNILKKTGCKSRNDIVHIFVSVST